MAKPVLRPVSHEGDAGVRVAVTTAVQQPNHVPNEVCVLHEVQVATQNALHGERETNLGSQSSALLADNASSLPTSRTAPHNL